MSELQPQTVLGIPNTIVGLKRGPHNVISNKRAAKKLKPTTMTASAEDRLSKAKAFVEKDIAEHKVGDSRDAMVAI
jgi:hypothetical protein